MAQRMFIYYCMLMNFVICMHWANVFGGHCPSNCSMFKNSAHRHSPFRSNGIPPMDAHSVAKKRKMLQRGSVISCG